MRKILLLALVFVTSFTAFGQDFSNKGKDFWLCFASHVPNSAANLPRLSIFITSDQASTGTVTMPNGAYSATFNLNAGNNYYQELIVNPTGAPGNYYIKAIESNTVINKSIRVKTDVGQPAVVVYAEEWAGARTAATLVLPVSVLGKKYYAVSASQANPSPGGTYGGVNYVSKSHFQIIATQSNTNVQITPVFNGIKQTAFTITLPNVGDLYQYEPPSSSTDITGTYIESLAGGSGGCLPIAVFSGTSGIALGASNGATNCTNVNSSDPLFQQLYPISSWGKNFGFIQFVNYSLGNPYRIIASENNTNVYINGALVATLNAGDLYPNNYTVSPPTLTAPSNITSDKPICVAQFLQSNACATGNGNLGDPDMVILNPIEQNISDITVFSSSQQAITQRFVNVLIKTAGTINFKINGANPSTAWLTSANLPGYSYLKGEPFPSTGSYRLSSDSGFNAIAYGYGANESYAYSAGSNVKDLSKELEIETTYGIESSPSVCTNAPFKFKFFIPDSTQGTPPVAIRFDSLRWDLSNPSLIVPNNFPIMVYPPGPPCTPSPCTVTYDSITIKNGKRVTWYSLPTTYYFNTPGNDTLLVTGYTSTNEGCGTDKLYDFAIVISDPPTASFNAAAPGCYAEPVVVTETTPQIPKTTYRQWWEFYDPVTNATTVYSNAPPNPPTPIRTVSHTFTTPGVKRIRHASITTPGCLSDTIVQNITLPDLPDATVAGSTTVCINSVPSVPVTFTGTLGTAEYIFSYNINGGGTLTTPPSTGGSYTINAPTNVAGPFTYNLIGVRNASPAGTPCTRVIAGQSITINITPDATVTLRPGDNDNQTVCINNPIVNIRYDVGGSGTGGSVSGLPAGVTGTYAAGVITITGTPTVPGIFNYTVTTTGPCITPQATGTITVTDDGTITLTSVAGSDNQTLCINTPLLTNITYALAGSATGGSVSGLPAGVTGVFAGGVITISGTPTVAGVFNYTVTTTGPCVIPTATGTITVTGDGTLTLTSAVGTDNQTRCINVAITNITYAVGGTGTGGTVSGLPPGVTGVFAGGVITISGTPTAIGTYNYTVTTTGPCVIPTVGGTITVNPDASIILTSATPTTSQELCRNSTITNITYAIAGGGTGAGVTGLPAGVTGVYAGGVFTISGTPTVAGLFNYTVTTTGTCVQNSLSGTILVNQLPTAAFTYTAPSCETRVISFTDASVANVGLLDQWIWDFNDGSPLEFIQNPTHVYAAAGPYNVTLTVRNNKGCISNPIALTVVNIDNRPQAGFIIPEVCLSDTYAQFTDTSKLTNAVINRWDWNFGDPGSGPLNVSTLQNPTHSYSAVGTYNVRLIVWNFAKGCRDTITQVLQVNGSFPIANFNVNNPATLCANDSVAIVEASTVFPGNITKIEIYWDNVNFPGVFQLDNTPFTGKVYRHLYPNFQAPLTKVFQIRYRAYSGGICVNDKLANISVNAAPLVQFNNMPNSCLLVPPFQITQASEIGGVPGSGTYSGPGVSPTGIFNPQTAGIGTHTILYTFTSTAAGCVDTMSNTITVLDTAHAAFSFVLPACEQTPVSFTDLSTAPASVTLANTVWNFGDATPIENHPPGSTFTHTFALPGTYNVTMHNVSAAGCLSTDTVASITIDPNHSISLNAGGNPNQSVCINTPITPILYTIGGGATGATVTGLPPGVTASVTGNLLTISGTPTATVLSPYNFNILTTGNTCVVATASGTITVKPDHAISLNSSNDNQTVCINTAIAPIVYTLSGGATGATVTGLPPGVTASVTGNLLTINGTPASTAGSPYNFNITTSGNSCIIATASGSIIVQADHTISLNGTNNNQTVCINIAITPIVYTLGGGATGATVTGLPAGITATVVGNSLTISGAPTTTVSSPFNFNVLTTGNSCIVANAAGSIAVNPDHAITFTSGDTAQSVCVNTPIDPIIYNLSGGATGVTIANLPPGVNFTVVGNILTISGTPTTSVGGPMFNFAIQTTGNTCVKANTIGEILVNDYPVPDFAFDKTSYCIPNATVGFINNTTPTPLSNHTYAWEFGDGGFSTAATPTHFYSSTGPFNVKLKAQSTVLLNNGVIGCESEKSKSLNIIHPQPKADFVFSKPSVCIGDNVTITDATDNKDGLPDKWNWDMGDGGKRVTNPVTYTYADTISYTITFYSINTLGCNSDTISKPFSVYPYPKVNAGPDKFVLEGGSVELEASAFAREPVYSWTPGDFLTDSKILRPRAVSPRTDMTYRLTVTGKGGCQLSDDVFVKLLKFPAIPNTFTPNGDGINDTWRIDYLNTYPNNRVQIFTRAGKLVFESKGYTTPWDGTLKGKPLPFDTYYYIIEPGNGRDAVTGYVTIIK